MLPRTPYIKPTFKLILESAERKELESRVQQAEQESKAGRAQGWE
jgi:hypothetical protein